MTEYIIEGNVGKIQFSYVVKSKRDRETFRKDIKALMKGVKLEPVEIQRFKYWRTELVEKIRLLKKQNAELERRFMWEKKITLDNVISRYVRDGVRNYIKGWDLNNDIRESIKGYLEGNCFPNPLTDFVKKVVKEEFQKKEGKQ